MTGSPSSGSNEQRPSTQSTSIFDDTFEDSCEAGQAGTVTSTGIERSIIDVERRVSVDRNALRFAPLRTAGWGRQGVSYGPVDRTPGLMFGALLLNGHNGSHSGGIDGGLRRRFLDWALGPRDRRPGRRVVDFIRSDRRAESLWLWKCWLSKWWLARTDDTVIEDNLVIGWFDERSPTEACGPGSYLTVRTNGAETGRVLANVRGGTADVLPTVFNVPTYYAVLLRPDGAIYYGASIAGVQGLPALPLMRPLAIDRDRQRPSASIDLGRSTLDARPRVETHAGIHQSVLGQVGFSADTRIYRAAARIDAQWSQWFASAHIADRLDGDGTVPNSRPEHGPTAWTEFNHSPLQRTATGAATNERAVGAAMIHTDVPSGLVALSVISGDPADEVGLLFRIRDRDNYTKVQVGPDGVRLIIVIDGNSELVASGMTHLEPGVEHLLQLSDDGVEIAAHIDDQPLVSACSPDHSEIEPCGVGVIVSGPRCRVRDFEAHPRLVEPDAPLGSVELPVPAGNTVLVSDDFNSAAADLIGRSPGVGLVWRRAIGEGVIEVNHAGARVVAALDSPNPGRTLYLLPWSLGGDRMDSAESVVDLEVTITPPGSGRGDGHMGRGGVVFWQDSDHYVIVSNWLDDTYPGASLSLFCRLGPFEDMFRAVWSNVGRRIDWGTPHVLRVAFDGDTLVGCIDGEVVLYRALSDVHKDSAPLSVREVGIAANWEWGNDTGSTFNQFVARSG